MKKTFHVVLFILAFQMEVRVRASAPSHSGEILSEPAQCLGVTTPCSFKVPAKPWSYSLGKVHLRAAPASLLQETVAGKEWKLMEGSLWVKNGPSVVIRTASAFVESSSGEYWVLADQKRVFFRNISARLVVTFKDQTTMEVPRGFEVWASQVDSNAKVQHGMVEPIRLKEHLKIWFQLYPGTKSQFLSEVQDLKDQWVDLTEQSGNIYQKVVSRKLAAIDEEQQRQQAAAKKRAEEKARLRQKFYNKVFQQ